MYKGASSGNVDLIKGGLLTGHNPRKCPRCKSALDAFPCKACGLKSVGSPRPNVPDSAVDFLSFRRWCSFLAVSVLRTRSAFSVFLRATLHLPRSSLLSTSPAFPLPVPFPGAFGRMPPGLSSAKRNRCHFRRAMHIVVMALNYWWSGSCSIPLEHLERTPSKCQLAIFRRLASLMLADGPVEPFEVLRSGRRFHFLVARLAELSEALTKLGVGAGPYEKVFPGHDVPLNNALFEELEPYRALDAERLKVVGSGHFDASPYLSPELCVAYRYPDALLLDRLPSSHEFPQKADPVDEVVKLAKLWDVRGLLHIHDVDIMRERRFELVRVFNCYKNSACDRQIGDRRGRNAVEGRVVGPSLSLPTGPDLLDLSLDCKSETLSIICTDRRDFYHQFSTTLNRTLSNTVGPTLPVEAVRDSLAFGRFLESKRSRYGSRLQQGDRLGTSERQSFRRCQEGTCMASFKSIFQGDHAGVEIATAAHEGLLQTVGLLSDETRLLSSKPFTGNSLCEGLVIDDYFAVAVVPRSLLVPSPAEACFRFSKDLYAKHDILGSDDKDITGARKAKLIGAVLDASPKCQDRGVVLVAALAEKRYSLSWVTLQLCQLSHTTDSLHLCLLGGWTSVLMFRRPLMSILSKSFRLVSMDNFDAACPKMVPLPRSIVNELTLLSILVPLCASDIAAPFCDQLFATDASLHKGAIVQAQVPQTVIQSLWRSCRSKGGYSKLLDKSQSILSRCLDFEEEEPDRSVSVKRPLAFRFDFVEVFAGAATVTSKVAQLGFSVCCPIDISFDRELDVASVFIIEWLIHLVSNHFVKAVMLEPPCTTFSVMRRPPLRSKEAPYGFDTQDEQTLTGTKLALRALQLLFVCLRAGVTGVVENPWSSKIKNLPPWRAIMDHDQCTMVRCDSCFYGSPHLKAFVFLCAWAHTNPIEGRCKGDHEHVQVAGALTKKSATYVEGLASALAVVMSEGIIRLRDFDFENAPEKVSGLESQLVNEVCLSCSWSLLSVWAFRVSSHINLLELSAVLRLVTRLVKKGKSLRVVILVDSNVVRCAASKGRSSSRALSRLLSRLAALSVVGGLFVVFGFIPTRWNPADDPTRDTILRSSIPGMDLAAWDRPDLFRLSCFPRCRRWCSNWVRLCLLLCGPVLLRCADRSCYATPRFPYGMSCGFVDFASDPCVPPLDFDSTLGFPGEGPSTDLVCNSRPLRLVLWVAMISSCAMAVLQPRNPGDLLRQSQRNARPPLQEGRPVLGVTSQLRSSYISQFEEWLFGHGVRLEVLLENSATRVDDVNRWLVSYGRCLYGVGRPYNHFAETINAVSAKKPALRRQLQEAWNLAFAWVRDEPTTHHIAIPWQVLLACISVSLIWGWVDLAGMLALTWGAVLRVGEFLSATRKDLLLPCDTNFTNSFALLALKEPKTRFTAARHQSAKLDIPDLLRVVHLAFARLQPQQKLWPRSGQTLRLRFKQVLEEIGIHSQVRLNGKSLDLGGLRAGGATWMIQVTEDSEFVRRRGRWINSRVMEIYLQEISCFQFLSAIPLSDRQKVFSLCNFFLQAVSGAEKFSAADIPPTVWYILWKRTS